MKKLKRMMNEDYSYKSSKGKTLNVNDDDGTIEDGDDTTLWLGQNGVEDWGSTIYITDIDYEMKKSKLFDYIRSDAADQVHSDRFKVWGKGLKRYAHGYYEDMEDEDIMKWIKTNPNNLKNYFSVNDPVVYAGGSSTVRLDDWLADREEDDESTMKKLNITKEQFNRSKYFQKKYGKLEYVSESGNLFKTNKGKVLKFVKESFYGIEGAKKDVDGAILYKGCIIEPSEFYENLGEMYDSEHPEDPNHEGFDDWCWENTDLIESELEHLASYDDNYEGDPYYKESKKFGKKFVKESTGEFVEVSAIVKGRGKTIEEAIENFDSEIGVMSSDQWDTWSDNFDGKDREYWIDEYNKWYEENGGDVDLTVIDDKDNAQGYYGRVTISNTDEY